MLSAPRPWWDANDIREKHLEGIGPAGLSVLTGRPLSEITEILNFPNKKADQNDQSTSQD